MKVEDVKIIDLGYPNSFYLQHGEESVLIDTGFKGEGEELFNLNDISHIILTHGHVDHIGNACELSEIFKAPIYIHEDDSHALLENRTPKRNVEVNNMEYFNYKTCEPDYEIGDGEDLPLDLKSIQISGHTTGNLSILAKKGSYRDKGILISGDTLIEIENELNLPYKEYCEDYEKAKNNLHKLLDYKFEKILPGHGSTIFDRQDLVTFLNKTKSLNQKKTFK